MGARTALNTFDVVLFGPTGVTGREVARYLDRRAPALGLRWAVAGRDQARIAEALGQVGARPDAVLLADTTDPTSIDAMVDRARVVANLVGPYARYGEPVHSACARAGVHQLDLTGEIDWVLEMIDRYHDVAMDSGAAIVPSAGFESLPFDLAARLAASLAYTRHASAVVEVDAAVTIATTARVGRIADAVSGGTYASMVDMIRRGGGQSSDPHALDPDRSTSGRRYDLRPRRHAGTGAWLAPLFPTPFLNPPVVHRSAALLRREGDPVFAADFRYREGSVAASLLPGPDLPGAAPALSAALGAGQYLVATAGRLPRIIKRPLADTLERIGPAPGDGPRPEALDAWSYRIDVRAVTEDGASADVAVDADGHPGYKSTATIVAEAALALATLDAPRAGYGTPATVLGLDDLARFAHAGMRFTPSGPG
ncbi:MAG: saccharopine dehydrogenase family protein [Ilumatobacteraceae bacterium]